MPLISTIGYPEIQKYTMDIAKALKEGFDLRKIRQDLRYPAIKKEGLAGLVDQLRFMQDNPDYLKSSGLGGGSQLDLQGNQFNQTPDGQPPGQLNQTQTDQQPGQPSAQPDQQPSQPGQQPPQPGQPGQSEVVTAGTNLSNLGLTQYGQQVTPMGMLKQSIMAALKKGQNEALGIASLGAGAREDEALISRLQEENNWPRSKALSALNVLRSGGTHFINGEKIPVSGSDQDFLDRLTKYGSDEAQRSQWRFASALDNLFHQADTVTPNAFKFAGIAGKLKGGINAAAAQFGENSQEYADYRNFTRVLLPSLATEILRTGGASSSDTQKLLAMTQADPIAWFNNPELAMKQFEFLKQVYKSIGKTISSGTYQLRTGLMGDQSGNAPPQPRPKLDFHSMSPAQVNKIANYKKNKATKGT